MPFDKNRLKRPNADKVLEKFISGATADVALKPKKGKEEQPQGKAVKKSAVPRSSEKVKAKAGTKKKEKPTPQPLAPAPQEKATRKTPEPKIPAEPIPEKPQTPSAADKTPVVSVVPSLQETPLVLPNDIKSGITLNLYHNLFKTFKALCHRDGKTPSDLFNKFMNEYLGG
ncbi:MAG TPA: hypothetical protein PKH10_03150 [bacterium]|nr:hypothetical protein [bacterium]HSA33754.1 hypothetical protein [bacterium]